MSRNLLPYQAGFDLLLNELGLSISSDWQSRSQLAKNVAEEIFQLVEELIEKNPEIKP